MGFFLGVAWSLAGALAHTGIDALRKKGADRIKAVDLVCLVAVLDATFSSLLICLFEGGFAQLVAIPNPHHFTTIVVLSSSLLLFSKLLYQKAL